MIGAAASGARLRILGLGVAGLFLMTPAMAAEPAPLPILDKDIHMGVASCAGSTCHGAVEPWMGSNVLQDEFITWQRKDKHAKAYQVLLEDRSKRIAGNLGLEAAHTAKVCLDCHADNLPPERRFHTFQITDGVGCEACHGGAGRWIGTHISAAASHERNIEAGLYPSANPKSRARLCLSCHFGDGTRFVSHRIMGAGHPRMSFELDTFTAIMPAHFKVDDDYRKRKGAWNGVQTWAIGQAMAIGSVLDAMIDPKRGRDGAFPELVLFDCYSCHHRMSNLRWAARDSVGLDPGIPRISDANHLMLRIIATQVDAALGKAVREKTLALHQATRVSQAAMVEAAKALKTVTGELIDRFAEHQFSKADMEALLAGVIDEGLRGEYADYPGAEQATMALGAIINAMLDTGAIDQQGFDALNAALETCYKAVENDEAYDPKAYVAALKGFKGKLAK